MADPMQRVALLTCSMARDLDLFALLARSVDAHVAEDIPHRVVVPSRDMAAFRPYRTARREIIAQEEVMPFRTLKIPNLPRVLSAMSPSLRRPFYLDSRLRLMRGWILQQILKIEMSRLAPEQAVMHVDSDVFIFRILAAQDVFRDGRPAFFRATGATGNPLHADWIATAAAFWASLHRPATSRITSRTACRGARRPCAP
jgi:hypothetical protein